MTMTKDASLACVISFLCAIRGEQGFGDIRPCAPWSAKIGAPHPFGRVPSACFSVSA
jgi:hypothetical protein